MKNTRVLLCGFCILFCSVVVQANIMRIEFGGIITSVTGGTASVGDSFSAFFVYDEVDKSSAESFPGIAYYSDAILSAGVNVGGRIYLFDTDGFAFHHINVYNNAPSAGDIDGYRYTLTESQPYGYYMRIRLIDSTQTLLDDDNLPSSLSLNMFDSTTFDFRARNSIDHFYSTKLNSISLFAIPEPCTFLLFGVGRLLIGKRQ